jgi:hypothetical protein
MALNEILLTVTLVIQLKNGGIIGSASGFFYTQSDRLYLVTNKHVVRGDKTAPDALRLRLHTDANDVLKNADYDVPLFKGGKPAWREHATAKEADIAASAATGACAREDVGETTPRGAASRLGVGAG